MIDVTHKGQVRELRNSDVTPYGTVTSVERATKWCYVNFEGGTRKRLELAAEITYIRSEQTEEEKAEDRRQYALGELRKVVVDKGDTARQLITDKLEAYDNKTWTTAMIFDHWDIDKLLTAQANRQLRLSIIATRDNLVEEYGISDDDAIVSAVYTNVFAPRAGRSLQNPLSRSTSAMSNIMDDLNAYVIQELRDDLKFVAHYIDMAAVDEAVTAQVKIVRDNTEGK